MWPRPWRAASARAASSITGERSTAVTDPGRCASGSARRPTPQPNSSVVIGANCGASAASITPSIQATRVSPLAKKRRSCSGMRLARRKRGSVTTAKYGSRAAKRSQPWSALFDTDAVHPQREMTLIAAAAGDEEFGRLDGDPAFGRVEDICRQHEGLVEIRRGVERADLAAGNDDAD